MGGLPTGWPYSSWGAAELLVAEPSPQDTGGPWLQGMGDDRASRSHGGLGSGSFLPEWWAHEDMEGCWGRGFDGQRRAHWDSPLQISPCHLAQVESLPENLLWAELQ